MKRKSFRPTSEQLAISQERKLMRQQKQASADDSNERGHILVRPWVQLQLQDIESRSDLQRIRILTWNLLAQCLVRRELFPGSDCLKANQREHMIHREILSQKAHIICLQEVDRLDKLLPTLEDATYSHIYAAGPGKRHGCLIAFDKAKFTMKENKVIHYDEQEVGTNRRGNSIRTSNIASMIALAPHEGGVGLIVATTHLFWHPKYAYERARQAGILVREVTRFRDDSGRSDWPCIICGDFNCPPDEATYSLLVGDPVSPAQEETLSLSRVVHLSVQEDTPLRPVIKATEENDYDPATDPDRTITNARLALPEDGLLSTDELVSLFSTHRPLRSAYDEAQRVHRAIQSTLPILGDRIQMPAHKKGAHEPMWTSYTHYWRNVLDYIFILDPELGEPTSITAFLEPHRTEDLQPGLPMLGICGSDHVSLCVDFVRSHVEPTQ